MRNWEDVEILRIYIGESDLSDGKSLYEAIVEEARLHGLAGATVTRGVLGYGANSLIHTSKILRLSEGLPVVIEIVDRAERINAFLPQVETMLREGMMTVETARAVFHCSMRIRDIMSCDVITVGPDDPLDQVVELLLRQNVKAAPVVKAGKVVGIITGGDLLSRANMDLRLSLQRGLPPQALAAEIEKLEAAGLRAHDIMTSDVVTISVLGKAEDAAGLMARKKLKRLPVVDERGNLVGIVSRVDILRTVARAAAVSGQLPELPRGMSLTADKVMFRRVPTARPDESLQAVLDKLVASPLRRVVITDDDGHVQGIVLDRDLVAIYGHPSKQGALQTLRNLLSASARQRLEEGEPLHGQARDVMQADVYTVPDDAPVSDILRIMVEKKVKRLTVTNPAGKLVGMVDRDSLIRLFGEEE